MENKRTGVLKLLVSKNCIDLGQRVNFELQKLRKDEVERIVAMDEPIFANGESKVVLKESVRDADLYYLTDVGNWGCMYRLHGIENHMSPQDHFRNIVSTVSAVRGHSDRLTVIEPLLYASRQHRRKGRESLDCAIALQELVDLGVDCIMTVDAHDPNVQNAIPRTPFENLYPSHYILEAILSEQNIDYKQVMAISPDYGATERTIYYANILGCPMGSFNKRRDYSKVVNGQNAIVSHEYNGGSVKDKNLFIVDDMIASGGSIIDTAVRLKENGANQIYMIASFCLFTDGIEKFDEAYENGLFEAIYTTNATYIPEEYKSRPWLRVVDIAPYIAEVIDAMNRGESISDLLNGRDKKLVLAKEVAKRKNLTLQRGK